MQSGEEESQGHLHWYHELFAGHTTTASLRLDAFCFYYFVNTHNLKNWVAYTTSVAALFYGISIE